MVAGYRRLTDGLCCGCDKEEEEEGGEGKREWVGREGGSKEREIWGRGKQDHHI